MECNKDEAFRAKTIAEKKLADKDFAGAKKFILKAQTLYPGLDGISQMLTTLEVYIAAEKKIGGEVDWYAILGVNPSDDDEIIRKSYRKLTLMLHPGKNKSVGADGAFKLLLTAGSFLSDKAKRLAYNQRRIRRGFQENDLSQEKREISKPNCEIDATPTRVDPGSIPAPPPPPVIDHRSDTFWTICHRCKMHYEYLKLYFNHTLLCPNCHKPFLAKEMSPPAHLDKPAKSSTHRHQNSSTHSNPYNPKSSGGFSSARKSSYDNANTNWGPSMRTNVPIDPSVALKAATAVQQVNDRLKRERDELYAGFPSKKKTENENGLPSGFGISYRNGGYVFSNRNNTANRTRELAPSEIRKMLMQKAQTEILRKISEWDSDEKETANNTTQITNHSENQEPAMNVPDPDFHDFDLDRTENSFEDNQVWAAYDDDDGMPRFYAMIHKVLSRNPLKLKISWLNSKTTAEFGSLNWLGCGFQKTCGQFRIGKHEINDSLNSFSQNVEWKKSPRGGVLIVPRKGEVWALYRNWSHNWDENVPDDVIHKYDMVQVIEDYNEEEGVRVSALVKYPGFKTVFHQCTDQSEVKVIPKEEMFRFSHQVPKFILTGNEAHNSPKDCLELDPAATPFDLIQEATESNQNGEEIRQI